MTLRLRLTLALLALTTVGLGIFGIATYQSFARSQYNQMDQSIREAMGFVTASSRANGQFDPNRGRRPPGNGLPAIWGGRYVDGAVTATVGQDQFTGPVLPADPPVNQPFTASDADGTEWRVLIAPDLDPHGDGGLYVAAAPLSGVTNSLNLLLLIEGSAAAVLLVVLGIGSWLILRRGLRPLEHMAESARSITASDLNDTDNLSMRVAPADDHTEVGELGLAINTMLGEIDEAFQERDRTEQRLRQFLADASHELRTPLTSIQGFAELFRLGLDQQANGSAAAGQGHVDVEIVLRRIEEESARMKDLVEDLLLLARLDETRPVDRGPVDLTILAADACSDAVATAPGRPVTLDAPEPVVVNGNQDHLRQAIANLVTNAVRHTPDGSAIEVSTALHLGVASVSVRDHGPGLDDQAMAHVFDRFWQADTARVGSGAGLGLAIVAGIASEHGGTVDVVNVPDGGARFTMRFPLNAPVPSAP